MPRQAEVRLDFGLEPPDFAAQLTCHFLPCDNRTYLAQSSERGRPGRLALSIDAQIPYGRDSRASAKLFEQIGANE